MKREVIGPRFPDCPGVAEAIEMTKDAKLGVLESLKAHGKPIAEDKEVVPKLTIQA